MLVLLFASLLTALTVWAVWKLVTYGQKAIAPLVVITVIIFFLRSFINYLYFTEGIEFHGIMKVLTNMVSNCMLPTCYIVMRLLCHLKPISKSSVCLYLLVILDVFCRAAVYLDTVPISQISSDPDIGFYLDGHYNSNMAIADLVDILQLIWISERIFKFLYKTHRDNLHLTGKAKLATTTVCVYAFLMLIFLIYPYPVESYQQVCDMKYSIEAVCICSLLVYIGLGSNGFFILDDNDEIVYFDEVPNYIKLKRKLDELITNQKIHRNPDLTIGMVAKILDTNSSTILYILKEDSDETFKSYISKARIGDAMDLILQNPDKPISEIATECGFSSPVYFAKAFKKFTGMSAKEWSER